MIDNTTTDLRLTKHFCLSEFTRSATAIRYGISNQPSEQQVQRLQAGAGAAAPTLRRDTYHQRVSLARTECSCGWGA